METIQIHHGWESKEARGEENGERSLYIQGDYPPFERPSDHDQRLRLYTRGQSKNMRRDEAYTVGPLCPCFSSDYLTDLFPHLPPNSRPSLLLSFVAISSLNTDYLFVNLQRKQSLLAHSLLILYILHLFIWAHLIQPIPGVGRTSGAAGGFNTHWHTHYTAQGMPMVENGQVSSTMKDTWLYN